MKPRPYIFPILISLLPVGLIILNIADIINVYSGHQDYPFGSDFFYSGSIYASRTIYVVYNMVFMTMLLALVFFAFKERWKAFIVLLAVNLVLFLWPFFAGN